MDVNQQINLKIKEEFDRQDIRFALPRQDIRLAPLRSIGQ
jgi:small-conductance mechanosensitive channel